MQVFRNEYFESLRVPPAGLGYPWAPGRVSVVDGQVDQVRLGKVRISKSPFSKKKNFEILAFEIVGRCPIKCFKFNKILFYFPTLMPSDTLLKVK